MRAWADYGLCKVEYDHGHGKIVKAVVIPQPNSTAAGSEEMSRDQMIQALKEGKTFVVLEERHNRWRKAGSLYLVNVEGEGYIRMNQSQIPRDSHRNLPEY